MGDEVRLDVSELPQDEPNVAQQPDLTKVTKQLEPRVFLRANHMDMWWPVVIWVDHYPPAFERRGHGRHLAD